MFILGAHYPIRGVEERAEAALYLWGQIYPSTPRSSKWSLSPRFPPKSLYMSSPPYYHIACPFPPWSDHRNHIWQITNFVIVQFSHPSAAFSFWRPDVFLSTLSKILNHCPSINVRDQVAHPHKKNIQNCNLHALRDISLYLVWFPAAKQHSIISQKTWFLKSNTLRTSSLVLQFLVRPRLCLFLKTSRPALERTQPPMVWVPTFFSGG